MKFEQQPNSEIHTKGYEEVKTHLRELFINKDQKKIDELYSDIRLFAGVFELDSKSIIEEIKKGLDLESSEEFVKMKKDLFLGHTLAEKNY